jgi:hypothetical protein
VKGRKRHLLVDVLGIPITNRVEPASISDPVAGSKLLAGLAPLWPTIRTIIADAGHNSRKQRAFKVAGPPGSSNAASLGLVSIGTCPKIMSKGVQSSETMIDVAAIRLMLNRISQ